MKCLHNRKFWAHRLRQMSHFRYCAIAPTGDFEAGEVKEPARQEVVRYWGRLGRATTTLTRGGAFPGRTQLHCKMTVFLRQLAVLVGASLTLEAALQARSLDTSHAVAWLHGSLDMPAGTCIAAGLGMGSLWNRPWARVTTSAALALRRTTGQPGERFAPRGIAVLHLFVENSVPFSTTPKIVRDVVPGPHHAVAAEYVHQRVHNRYLSAMRRLGNATGAIALMARHVAQSYEHTFDTGLDRRMGGVAAVATIVVGAVIGTLIASIMGAPLSITELAT